MTERITLTLYDANDEPVKTLSRSGIRWSMLKRIVRLDDVLEESGSPEERLEVIIDAVASMFEGQATLEEIESGCNYDEAIACFRQIMAMVAAQKRANFQTGAANPPRRATRT